MEFTKYEERRESVRAVQLLNIEQIPEILGELYDGTFFISGSHNPIEFTVEIRPTGGPAIVARRGDYLVPRSCGFDVIPYEEFRAKWDTGSEYFV